MNTLYSLLLNYSYTTLLSHTHMYIPTYITIYSDIDVSIMLHHIHYVYICMYTYSIILLIYISHYIYILYPPIILHTLLHSISIYTTILYLYIIYNNIQILSITIYITCIQYVNINSSIYIVYYISYTHTYVHHIVYIYT